MTKIDWALRLLTRDDRDFERLHAGKQLLALTTSTARGCEHVELLCSGLEVPIANSEIQPSDDCPPHAALRSLFSAESPITSIGDVDLDLPGDDIECRL